MRKLIITAITAAIAIGAAIPASAWSRSHCDIASEMGRRVVSNDKYVKECHAFMIGEGVISSGKHKGNRWKKSYEFVHFVSADDSKVRIKNYGIGLDNKYVIFVNGHEQHRTKQIADIDFKGWLAKSKMERKDVPYTNSKDAKTYGLEYIQ